MGLLMPVESRSAPADKPSCLLRCLACCPRLGDDCEFLTDDDGVADRSAESGTGVAGDRDARIHTFDDEFAFALRQGGEHVQHPPDSRCCRVYPVRNRLATPDGVSGFGVVEEALHAWT